MTTPDPTMHAVSRLAQRGLSLSDVELAMIYGRDVEGGVYLLAKDCRRTASDLRRIADRIERLAGTRLVLADGRLVTAYPAGKRKARRLLRHAERRNLA